MHDLIDIIADRVRPDGRGAVVHPMWKGSRAYEIPAEEPSRESVAEPISIAEYLYAHYYACDPEMIEYLPLFRTHRAAEWMKDRSFVQKLRTANPGSGHQSPDWKVTDRAADGGMFIEKNETVLFVEASEAERRNRNAKAGDMITALFPKDAVHGTPGFYVAFSDHGPVNFSLTSRIYLHLTPAAAPRVMSALLGKLLDEHIRYTFKVLNNPRLFSRRDSAVLYISRSDYARVAQLAMDVYSRNSDAFDEGVPGLTKAIAPGIAVADDPATADSSIVLSFGQHRMACVADGIEAAVRSGETTASAVRESIEESLRRAGIDPARPHLNSISSPDYEVP